jgi:riboflavin synthase
LKSTSLFPSIHFIMFTGIINGVGLISHIEHLGADASFGKRLTISAPEAYLSDVGLGDSIALNGACMTVTSFDMAASQFTIDISAESLSKTAGLDRLGRINLEKALRAQDRLGGHIVSGHVDGVGMVSHFAMLGESWALRIVCPLVLAKYLATKGSATINGVSLTTNSVTDTPEGCEISINLIPHTIENTALGELKVGSAVNLEIDLIARYVERMLSNTNLKS